jgi:hypothetical protein
MTIGVVGAINDVVLGVLAATAQEGVAIVVAAKAVTKGVILGVYDIGGDVANAAYAATRASVTAASNLGADVGMAAWRSLQGAVEAGTEIGGQGGKLIEASTKGAVEAVLTSGKAALGAVEQVIVAVAETIRSVVASAVPAEAAKSRPPSGGISARRRPAKPQAKDWPKARRARPTIKSSNDKIAKPRKPSAQAKRKRQRS